jgi:uncharacterized protein YjbI with pentapeptide repeats
LNGYRVTLDAPRYLFYIVMVYIVMVKDFNHQGLSGRSFKGQNLAGANFSHTDIRGADFTNANLASADFSHAKAGNQFHWVIGTVCSLLIVVIIAGFISAYAGAFIGGLIVKGGDPAIFWSSISAIIVLIIFIIVTVRQGLGVALGASAITLAAGVAMFAALMQQPDFIAVAIVQSLGIASAISGSIVGAIAIATAWTIARKLVPLTIIFAIAGAIPGALEGVGVLSNSPDGLPKNVMPVALLVTGTITMGLIGLSLYMSSRIVKGDKRFIPIPTLVNALSSLGGTRFRGANLTDANFTQARLKSVDLRTANLTRTCWFQTHKLSHARIKGTYLEHPSVRHLVITKEGQNYSFDGLDLRSLNLKDANLQEASFIRTDLSDTNLQNANLARAKLVKAHLYQADLTSACLTGAYIQDWGISTDTKLDAVQCDYIYMHLPTTNDPDPCRKPDNRREVFKEGDFSDFIAPIIKTLDLYRSQNVDPRRMASTFKTLDLFHHEGIDPSAAALTLQQIIAQYPEAELEIVALEGRGNDKIRLQAKVTDAVDRSELSEAYFAAYTQVKALPYGDIQALLTGIEEKDQRIVSLEKLLENALQQPKFYVETYQNQGEFVMSQNKGNVNISGIQGNISGIAAAGESQTMTGVALGDVSGSITNTINQPPPSSTPDIPDIQELLAQLQSAIESESTLPNEDKSEALEQVKILAKAGQNPSDSGSQKAAKTAIKILKGTAAELPNTPLTAELNRLLPTIANILATGGDATPPVKSILLLAANPKGTATLRLDEEARALQNGLERSRYRDQFAIQQRWAVTPTEVRRALLDLKPKIVHFSGHGIGRDPNPTPLKCSQKTGQVDKIV